MQQLENHHVNARADNGTDDNTELLCRKCHLALHGVDFARWSSAWHQWYKEVNPEGYREHQRNAGRMRQAKLRAFLGETQYRSYMRSLAFLRWKHIEPA